MRFWKHTARDTGLDAVPTTAHAATGGTWQTLLALAEREGGDLHEGELADPLGILLEHPLDRVQPLGGRWQRLADAAGSVRVGMQRVVLAPGQMITPPSRGIFRPDIRKCPAAYCALSQRMCAFMAASISVSSAV